MSNKKYFNQPIEINNSGDLTVVSLSSSTANEYLVAVDGNGKFIKTEIDNFVESFDKQIIFNSGNTLSGNSNLTFDLDSFNTYSACIQNNLIGDDLLNGVGTFNNNGQGWSIIGSSKYVSFAENNAVLDFTIDSLESIEGIRSNYGDIQLLPNTQYTISFDLDLDYTSGILELSIGYSSNLYPIDTWSTNISNQRIIRTFTTPNDGITRQTITFRELSPDPNYIATIDNVVLYEGNISENLPTYSFTNNKNSGMGLKSNCLSFLLSGNTSISLYSGETISNNIISYESEKTITDDRNLVDKGYVDQAISDSGGTDLLSDLIDVTITSPSSGETLVYDNGIWINSSTTVDLSSYYTKTESDNNFLSASTLNTSSNNEVLYLSSGNISSSSDFTFDESEVNINVTTYLNDVVEILGNTFISGSTSIYSDLYVKDFVKLNTYTNGSLDNGSIWYNSSLYFQSASTSIDLLDKIPKVTGATNNLPKFNSDGELVDSGIEAVEEFFDLIDFIELTSVNEDDVSFVIPAKYRITSIVIEEISGSSAGNVSIGTSTGGTNVVNSETVGANTLVDCALGDTIFSKTNSTVLYISSSTWGSGGVDISVRIEKFTE